jgi:hypothetical protein
VTILLGETAATVPTAARVRDVLIAHDSLVSYHGSERVVGELVSAYPGARLVKSLDRARTLTPDPAARRAFAAPKESPAGDFAA